jgi:ketosteroid isomerase-like protein
MVALDPHIRGADRVRELFARIRAGDDRAADLYADDGVFLVGGARVEGREAIRAFYRRGFGLHQSQPEVTLVLSAPDSDMYAALLDVRTNQGLVHVFDLFTIDDEGIRRLEVFSRAIG